MKKLVTSLMIAASLFTPACAYNLAVKKGGDRVYANTSLKSTAAFAMQAINESNLAVQSSTNPVNGMVVITARGTENTLLQIKAPQLTLTLTEVDPTKVRVEAMAILPGQSADFGLTDSMVGSVFTSLDGKLAAAAGK
jgi:hypothetical protein